RSNVRPVFGGAAMESQVAPGQGRRGGGSVNASAGRLAPRLGTTFVAAGRGARTIAPAPRAAQDSWKPDTGLVVPRAVVPPRGRWDGSCRTTRPTAGSHGTSPAGSPASNSDRSVPRGRPGRVRARLSGRRRPGRFRRGPHNPRARLRYRREGDRPGRARPIHAAARSPA